jgi:hypothetical protein
MQMRNIYVHARGTSCNLPTFPHTVDLPPPIRLGFALHEVVVIGTTSSTDEEGGAHERSGAGTDLFDFWDVIWEGSGVDEKMLIEPMANVSFADRKMKSVLSWLVAPTFCSN